MHLFLKTLLRVAAFPLLFGGAGIIAWAAFSADAVTWLMPLLVAAVLVLTVLLERIVPYAHRWNSGPGTAEDLVYLGTTSAIVSVAEAAAWALALALLPLLEFGLIASTSPWPDTWPVLAQVLLALALGDALPYFYHRASHESAGFLWRVHAIHHAPERLHALNFARFHPVNAFLTAALTLLPLALLGAPPPVLFVAAVLHNVHGVLSHANVDFRLGPLNAVFSMAQLHRWHHARDPRLANGNYGATLLIWDWVFGTRRDPGHGVADDGVGLWPGSNVPPGLPAQWRYPFSGIGQQLARRTSTLLDLPCCRRA